MAMLARTLDVPRVDTALPVPLHSDAETITQRGICWLRAQLPFESDTRRELFLEEGHCLWVCLLFPYGERDRVQNICDLTLLLFATDDALVDRATDGHALCGTAAAVLSGREPPGTSPWAGALRDVWERLNADMSPSQLDRVRRAIKLLYRGALHERRLRTARHIPTFAEYMALRKASVGASIYFVLAEYARAIELEGSPLRDPALRALRDIACEHLILTNDLFSFRKELDAGDAINAVAVLQQERRLDELQATTLIRELVEDRERIFLEQRAAIAASQLGSEPSVHLTLEGFGDLLAGNLRWSCLTPRYHGPAHRWEGATTTEAALLALGNA